MNFQTWSLRATQCFVAERCCVFIESLERMNQKLAHNSGHFFRFQLVFLSESVEWMIQKLTHKYSRFLWGAGTDWSLSSWTGQLPLMSDLLWSTFQHKNGPIDLPSQTRVSMSWGQQRLCLSDFLKPTQLPADQLKSSEILRTGYICSSMMDTSNQDATLLMIFSSRMRW